jgi:hypothetical protein
MRRRRRAAAKGGERASRSARSALPYARCACWSGVMAREWTDVKHCDTAHSDRFRHDDVRVSTIADPHIPIASSYDDKNALRASTARYGTS